MSTTSTTPGNIPTPTPDQISQTTTAALASADTGSADTILNLKMAHNARLSQLKRTADTLKKQLGPDDPSVKAAEAAVQVGSAKVASISVVHQELDTPTPQVAADGWALHGRVYSSDLKPLAKYTVFLVDIQKIYQEVYGFSYTDNTGYFLFNVSGAKTTPPLFLAMTNAKGEPVYLSTTPFQPAPASMTYQVITLPSGTQPLGDPPPAIRNVALPGRKTKPSTKQK
jgi:dipeptidyl aminopeptidase/acylaminoacyl peptidase